MRVTKALLSGIAALGLSTGAVFAGGDSMSHEAYQSYEQGGPELLSEAPQSEPMDSYEVYETYVVPADEIVLIPLEEPGEVPISGDELG